MNKIWFSNDYEKLPKDWMESKCYLISVCKVKLSEFDSNAPAFLYFDTKFREGDQNYEIHFNDALILVFYHPDSNKLFSTIRSFKEEKFKYYSNLISKEFTMKMLKK